jgi:hypothetical protein
MKRFCSQANQPNCEITEILAECTDYLLLGPLNCHISLQSTLPGTTLSIKPHLNLESCSDHEL